MARNTPLINADQIKMEALHTFDNIDGELNISSSDSVNSEMASQPVDIKTEMGAEQTDKSVDDFGLSNGNFGLKVECRDNNNSPTEKIYEDAAEKRWPLDSLFNAPAKEICEVAAVDQNCNIADTETARDLMAVAGENVQTTKAGSGRASNARRKSANSAESELNNSRINNRSGLNISGSSDNNFILKISDDSANSDTDEVESDSNDCIVEAADDQNQIVQKSELPVEELQDSVIENHEDDESIDESLDEASLDNSDTLESRTRKKRKNKSNPNQSTLLKFLVPRQPLTHESSGIIKGNGGSPVLPRISISHLIFSSCVNCDKGYTTFGIKAKKCRDCGKRMKMNCFICRKLYNTHGGIYGHVVQVHRFSLKLFNQKVHEFVNRFCSKCKDTFNSQHSTCSKCNLNLKFICLVCNERCETRPRFYMHVVQNHTEVFVTAPETADIDSGMSVQIKTEKSPLKNDEDWKDASSIVAAASKNSDLKQQRRVRFHLDNAEADEKKEIEDISKSEATVKALYPTPRYPAKRRSVGAKTEQNSTDNSNSEITNKLPESKQSVPNRRQSTNVNLNSSKSKKVIEAETEGTSKTPTGSKQQVAGKRRSNRVNLNSSEANNDSEAINSKGLSTKSSSFVSNTSARRKSIQGQMKNSAKSEDKIAPKKPVAQHIKRRRNSSISSDNSIKNESTSVHDISVAEILVPKQINNKRQRSKSMTDISERNNNPEITFVEVHPVPTKIESKEQIAIRKQRSFWTMSNSSETSNHNETPNVPPVSTQQITAKSRRNRKTPANAVKSSNFENSYTDETPVSKIAALKPTVGQGKRQSLRAMLDTSETNSYSEITPAPEMKASVLQAVNKRRKSENSISAEYDDSYSEIPDVPYIYICSVCQKRFLNKKSWKQHEGHCIKGPDLVCETCSYTTKYATNLKRHKFILHGSLKETAETTTPRVLLNRNVDYGALYTIDSTCTDILSRMEAHCPKCKEDAKMKPNDSNCLKCKSEPMLSCVKCSKVFPNFLAIFNHLCTECTEKEYHCARCSFITASLDTVQDHVLNDHANVSSNARGSEKSSETPFAFAAQPQSPVTLSETKMNLNVGFKTRAQSRVKSREKTAVEAGEDQNERKLKKKCPKCNVMVPSVVKHLTQCKIELRCPFCSYVAKVKSYMRTHLIKCHSDKSHTVKFQAVFCNDTFSRPDIEDMMRSYCRVCDELKESVPYGFKCETCGTDFEYRCTRCQGRFALREQLRKHVWSHARTLKYLRCTGCSKEFAFVENLRMHEKVCTATLVDASI